jgi:molybdopterin-guanine dinucleotide biosynthesis protein A
MGFDKAMLDVSGSPNALRLARELCKVTSGVLVEVGPGFTHLTSVREAPTGSGPLAALAAGASYLRRRCYAGPALVLACDLPFVDAAVLKVLAGWPGEASIVPVEEGVAQPLCARWSAAGLGLAVELVARGRRAMKALLEVADVELVDVAELAAQMPAHEGPLLADVDTPDDLGRFGVEPPQAPLTSGPGGAAGAEGG